jgi:hypothetical protein
VSSVTALGLRERSERPVVTTPETADPAGANH